MANESINLNVNIVANGVNQATSDIKKLADSLNTVNGIVQKLGSNRYAGSGNLFLPGNAGLRNRNMGIMYGGSGGAGIPMGLPYTSSTYWRPPISSTSRALATIPGITDLVNVGGTYQMPPPQRYGGLSLYGGGGGAGRPPNGAYGGLFGNSRNWRQYQTEEPLSGRQQYYMGFMLSNIGYAAQRMATVITASVGLSVKAFSDLEKAIKNTQSVTGATSEDMISLTNISLNLSKQTRYGANEIADAMYYLGSAGYTTKEILQSIEPITKLAQGTQSKLADTTEFVATTLAAFNLDASKAGEVSNILASSIVHTQTTMEKLKTSMSYIGPLASELGLDFKEVVAVLGAAADVGMRASQMGAYLRRILQELSNPTKQSAMEFAKLGLTIKDTLPSESNSLAQIFEKLKNSGMTTAQAFTIFKVRGAELATVLERMGGPGIEKYKDQLNDLNALDKIVQIQTESLTTSFQKLWHSVTALGQAIGQDLAPFLQTLIRALQDTINATISFWGNLGATTKEVVGLVGSLTVLELFLIGKLLPVIGVFVSGTIQMFSVLKDMGKALSVVTGAWAALLTRIAVGIGVVVTATWVISQFVAAHYKAQAQLENHQKLLQEYGNEYVRLAQKTSLSTEENNRLILVKQRLIMLAPELKSSLESEKKGIDDVNKSLEVQNVIKKRSLELAKESIVAKMKETERDLGEAQQRLTQLTNKYQFDVTQGMKKKYLLDEAYQLGLQRKRVGALKVTLREQQESFYKTDRMSKILSDKRLTADQKVELIKRSESKKTADVTDKISEETKERLRKNQLDVNEFIAEGALLKRGLDKTSYDYKILLLQKEYEDSVAKMRETAYWENLSAEERNAQLLALTESFQEQKKQLWMNEYFDFTWTQKEISQTFSDTIYDMIKGVKTWEDVWQSVLDQSLRYFIEGFVSGVMRSYGDMIAQMMGSFMNVATGGGGGLWSGIFNAFLGGSNAGNLTFSPYTGGGGFGAPFVAMAGGGIVNSPTYAMVGEKGPEAVVPLSEYNKSSKDSLTIVNVVDPSFVPSSIAKNPDTVINVITGDIVNSGQTRKVIRRYVQ